MPRSSRAKLSGTPYVITRRVNNPIGTHALARMTYTQAAAVAGVATEIATLVQAYDARVTSCVIHSATSQLPVNTDARAGNSGRAAR